MELNKIIEKINYYSALIKKRKLTVDEELDREKHKKLYLSQFRDQMKDKLDQIKIID